MTLNVWCCPANEYIWIGPAQVYVDPTWRKNWVYMESSTEVYMLRHSSAAKWDSILAKKAGRYPKLGRVTRQILWIHSKFGTKSGSVYWISLDHCLGTGTLSSQDAGSMLGQRRKTLAQHGSRVLSSPDSERDCVRTPPSWKMDMLQIITHSGHLTKWGARAWIMQWRRLAQSNHPHKTNYAGLEWWHLISLLDTKQ